MTRDTATCLTGESMDEPREWKFSMGSAVAYTAARPGESATNEDALVMVPFDAETLVLAVADGMGGARSGEKASALIVEEIMATMNSGASDQPGVRAAILNAMEEANRKVQVLGVGAAATLAVVQIQAASIRSYHVGDAAALLFGRKGKLKFETGSHSPVGFGVQAGLLGPNEAMHHEERHLVTNVVGCPEMKIEIGPHRAMAVNDTLIVASDGLFDNVLVEEIVSGLRKGPLPEAVSALVRETRRRMENPGEELPSKPDDVTIIAFRRNAP